MRGPIGGLEQTGKWKIDARFNRAGLSARIRAIQNMAARIEITQEDALDFISVASRAVLPVLFYVDPPYLVTRYQLYLNAHSWLAHEKLADALSGTSHPWVLTYDFDERVRNLYPANRCLAYSISHTAQDRGIGQEFMLFSRGLNIGDVTVASSRQGTWVSRPEYA